MHAEPAKWAASCVVIQIISSFLAIKVFLLPSSVEEGKIIVSEQMQLFGPPQVLLDAAVVEFDENMGYNIWVLYERCDQAGRWSS